ncbi:hypothetical protein [Microbacterium stercoris]|uniref:DUF2746 domain-containing protein n=1 Tax=Microbacterium stercoris TaxID=2820289 RepID=A0A939QLC3_9MICO|nr:hypothetical protein [Microbacterium stercoris]MBO3662890.1 hypothetical protein [Microbacterium stercoris]
MQVSAELIAIIAVGVAMIGSLGWVMTRFDAKLDSVEGRLETRIGSRIDAVEHRLGSRIDAVEHRLGTIESEIVELKVAVARIEGPRPRFATR